MPSETTASATSSPGSAAGRSPSGGPAGTTTDPYGLAPVPVSRFRALDSDKAMPTSDTSGPLFTASSPSAALQFALENKLEEILAGSGSPLYALIWRPLDMPSGLPILQLRALARRIYDSGCTGWPTPNAGPQNDTDTKWQERRERVKAEKKNGNGFGLTLGMAAQMSGWATPRSTEYRPLDGEPREIGGPQVALGGSGVPRRMGNPHVSGSQGRGVVATRTQRGSAWAASSLIPCADGKARPTEPGVHPLADGVPGRVGQLSAYGNAIVPQVASAFVRAYMESRDAIRV